MRFAYALDVPAADGPWPSAQPAGSDWKVWADISTRGVIEGLESSDSDALSGMQVNGLVGLSHKLTPDLLVGVLGGYEAFDYRSVDLDATLEGSGWTVGGYVGGRADRLRYFAAAGYTGLGYDGTAGLASGSFDAQRLIISGGLSGSFDALGMTVEPALSIFGLWEHQDAYTDSLGVDQSEREFSSGRISAGVKLMHEFGIDSGISVLPYAGLYADYTAGNDDAELADLGLGDGGIAGDGLTGRLIGGFDLTMKGGASLHFGGEIGGLGGDLQTWSIKAGMKAPL
jgi:hypothetical protein